MANKIKVTQVRSVIGTPPNHRRTVRALGLRKMHQTVEHDDTPSIRGMINQVSHLVKVEE
jgi:large subunit ribosomal protein L30